MRKKARGARKALDGNSDGASAVEECERERQSEWEQRWRVRGGVTSLTVSIA